jgi:plasmid stability protein
MQYTLRNVPSHLDKALRRRAQDQGKSLNDVAVEALLNGLGLSGKPVKHRDLGDIAGTWVDDPEIDEALAEQRRIDPGLWR